MGLKLFSKYYSDFLVDVIRLEFGKHCVKSVHVRTRKNSVSGHFLRSESSNTPGYGMKGFRSNVPELLLKIIVVKITVKLTGKDAWWSLRLIEL